MPDWSKIGRSSRAKGARHELATVHEINETFWDMTGFGTDRFPVVERSSRGVKQNEGDLTLLNKDFWPFTVEVKYVTRSMSLEEWLQVDSKTFGPWRTDLLLVRRSMRPTVVAYRWDLWRGVVGPVRLISIGLETGNVNIADWPSFLSWWANKTRAARSRPVHVETSS